VSEQAQRRRLLALPPERAVEASGGGLAPIPSNLYSCTARRPDSRRGGDGHARTTWSAPAGPPYIGCSNFSGWHLMKRWRCREKNTACALRRPPGLLFRSSAAITNGRLSAGPSTERWPRSSEPARLGRPSPGRPKGPAVPPDQPHAEQARDRDWAAGAESTSTSRRRHRRGRRQTQDGAADRVNWLLQRPSVANVMIGARNEEKSGRTSAPSDEPHRGEVALLDAASATAPLTPYWHQRGSRSGIRLGCEAVGLTPVLPPDLLGQGSVPALVEGVKAHRSRRPAHAPKEMFSAPSLAAL